MKAKLFWILPVLLLAACGGRNMSQTASADAAYEPAQSYPEESAGGQAYPQAAPAPWNTEYEEGYADDASPDMAGIEMDGGDVVESSFSGVKKSDSQMSRESVKPPGSSGTKMQQQPTSGDRQAKGPAPDGPMIVYNGYLHLRVRRLMDALDDISKITKDHGGYVDSMTQRSIVVRIPGKDFDALLTIFAKLGDVLSREISAVEVTEQYTDLTSRLAVAKETRDRLLSLLEKVSKAEERLRILEEIKRLSEEMESIKSTLSTLETLLKYFTVTIDLTPILQDETSIQHQSPFAWIQELSPHRTTLFGAVDSMRMTLPRDFVFFSKSDDYRAQSADTTVVRGGIMENDPRGDNTFWADAIAYEMTGRSEALEEKGVAKGKNGSVSWLIFKNDDLQPRWYLVGVHVHGDSIYVVEVFFPNEESYKSHRDDLLKSLDTFEVRQ
ncbi:MAG: DUF4349 domain-containing protein [Deltaproteobacteria bacterium]|nr:DUF4349 domain-containing protein [Deltaproteobacteria bacterium]